MIVLISSGLGRLKGRSCDRHVKKSTVPYSRHSEEPTALYFKEASLPGRLVHKGLSAVPHADGVGKVGDGGV